MPLNKTIFRNCLTVLMLILAAATTAAAQNAPAAPAAPVESSHNWLVTLLVIMIAVLAFAIWGLGMVLTGLSRQLLEKIKKSKAGAAVITAMLLLSSLYANAQATPVEPKVEPNYGGVSSTTFYLFVTVIIIEIVTLFFFLFSIKRIYNELLPKAATAARNSSFKPWWSMIDKKYFTKAVPVAKEADVLLNHNYDGIQELDNALPPWWKYGFYITIVAGIVYLLNFHVFANGKNPEQEYIAELAEAKIQQEIYESQNKDKIDEANISMADADGLAYAKRQFKEKCIACHGEFAEGKPGLGPNLTDNYWIHKGSLNDIYQSIKNGYPDKGMQAWSSVYTPKEMSYLASFIKSLKGSNPPNAKAPQGDLYTESADADSVKNVKKDTAVNVKAQIQKTGTSVKK